MIQFSIDDANAIYRLGQVDDYMPRHARIVSRDFDIPNVVGHSTDTERLYIDRDLQKWEWIGTPVDPKRFVIHHEITVMGLTQAMRELEGHDLQQILIRLRMVNKDDDPYGHAYALATAAVDYSVRLQYGASGLKSYHRHMEKQVKDHTRVTRVPMDLDLTPYRDDTPMRVFLATKMVKP